MKILSVICISILGSICLGIEPSGPVDPKGNERATVDLNKSQHIRNIGGSDGQGLCVFTSIYHAGRWQNIDALKDFRDWMAKKPGGGYPEKVDAMLKQYCAEKKVVLPDYIQHEGGEEEFLVAALKTGRVVCVTYAGMDDFYGQQAIAHMVNLMHLDKTRAAILDNNRPGVWIWMTHDEFMNRWKGLNDRGQPLRIGRQEVGGGWGIAFLAASPPTYTVLPVAYSNWNLTEQCANGQCRVPNYAPTPIHTADAFTGWKEESYGWVRWENGLHRGTLIDGEWHTGDPSCEKYEIAVSAFPDDLIDPSKPKIPTGVVSEKLGKRVVYSMRGECVSKHQAFGALANGVVDDTDKFHLSIVGDKAYQDKANGVLAQLKAQYPDAYNKLLIQIYAPDSWEVSQFSLKKGFSLRGPSATRVSPEIGVFDPADLQLLLDLLRVAKILPPLVVPDPVPLPNPDAPLVNPKAPLKVSTGWFVAGILGVVSLIYFWRKK